MAQFAIQVVHLGLARNTLLDRGLFGLVGFGDDQWSMAGDPAKTEGTTYQEHPCLP